jgi:hypothetical protein
MQLMPGETILITGGASLVGQAAAAIARWRGAEPIIAGRRHKPGGNGHFIDTTAADLPEAVLELTGGRGADLALDTVGGALFVPALRSLRFGGRMAGIFSAPGPQPDFSVAEIYNRQLHVTGLASVFMDGADVARIFDQLRPLFDRGLLTAPAFKTWPLENSAEAYQAVLDGSAGIKQVLVPAGGGLLPARSPLHRPSGLLICISRQWLQLRCTAPSTGSASSPTPAAGTPASCSGPSPRSGPALARQLARRACPRLNRAAPDDHPSWLRRARRGDVACHAKRDNSRTRPLGENIF